MKKFFITLSLVLSIAVVHAQINYGAKGGLAITSLAGEGYNAKTGIHLGGFAQIPVKGSFLLQPEIYFATQGANWEGEGKTSLNYLNIPVLAKYVSTSGFYGETGPQIGFMLSAHDTYKGVKEDVKQYLNTTDFSWSFGGGYQVNDQLAVNARYNLGLTKFWKDEKNMAFLVGLQYTISSSKK